MQARYHLVDITDVPDLPPLVSELPRDHVDRLTWILCKMLCSKLSIANVLKYLISVGIYETQQQKYIKNMAGYFAQCVSELLPKNVVKVTSFQPYSMWVSHFSTGDFHYFNYHGCN